MQHIHLRIEFSVCYKNNNKDIFRQKKTCHTCILGRRYYMRSALAKPAKSSWSCFEKNSIFKKRYINWTKEPMFYHGCSVGFE